MRSAYFLKTLRMTMTLKRILESFSILRRIYNLRNLIEDEKFWLGFSHIWMVIFEFLSRKFARRALKRRFSARKGIAADVCHVKVAGMWFGQREGCRFVGARDFGCVCCFLGRVKKTARHNKTLARREATRHSSKICHWFRCRAKPLSSRVRSERWGARGLESIRLQIDFSLR